MCFCSHRLTDLAGPPYDVHGFPRLGIVGSDRHSALGLNCLAKLLCFGALTAFVALGCASPEDTMPERDVLKELKSQGPYGVGFTSQSITYKTPISNEDRTIQALVWYPSDEREGERPLYLVK